MEGFVIIIRPKELFKFKKVCTDEDLKRIINIIENKKIYIPKVSQLNDPFEATAVNFSLAVAGDNLRRELGYRYPLSAISENNIRVLSFSSEIKELLMWSHYCNNFEGCCLVFSSCDNIFSDVRPVIYTDSVFDVDCFKKHEDLKTEMIQEMLLFKNKNWLYENEWRIIKNDDCLNDNYIYFENALIGIVLGHRIKKRYKNIIINYCKKHKIPYVKTYLQPGFSNIDFVPLNTKSLEYNKNSALIKYCKNKKVNDFLHILYE